MVATVDIRFKRMQKQYQTLHDSQDEVFDKVDSFEAALLGLNESVASNHDLSQRQIAELHQKLDAILQHLDVPYKPPVGFVKE